MNYGVTKAGFIKKPFHVIKEEIESLITSPDNFGPDEDISEYSPLGIFAGIFATRESEWWDRLEDNYYSRYIDTATGASLDRALAFRGLKRNPAAKSITTLEITGDDDVFISVGFIAQTKKGIKFITRQEGTITRGSVSLEAECMEEGVIGNVSADTIVEANTVIPGVASVTNPIEAKGGRDLESDYEARERYKNLGGIGGSSAIAIEAALSDLDSISTCAVYENESNTIKDEMPPHSIHAIIEGGSDQDIAQALHTYKAGGIQTYGSQFYTIVDSKGQARTYFFSHPCPLNVYVIVNVVTNEEWESSYSDEVKKRVVTEIGGTFQGIAYTGGGIGENVYSYKVIGEIDGISGIDNLEVFVGASPSPSGIIVDVDMNEYARCESDFIEVNIL